MKGKKEERREGRREGGVGRSGERGRRKILKTKAV